ncbi:MAG TPA: recombinase family protein [Verrucomicrobiae bacterium]|nr:recombinase family protein [Verrucomicrobiae bacterium]
MIYGYARVSTGGQDLAGQLERLEKAGCNRIFHEKRSGKDTERPRLKAMLKAVRPGDMVLATSTDRLARNPLDLITILRTLQQKGAGVRLLDEPFIDTTAELADLVLYVVGWAAHWQRRNILRCTAAGRERALARGVKFGRKPKLTADQKAVALARLHAGESTSLVAADLNVSESTLFRVKRAARFRP